MNAADTGKIGLQKQQRFLPTRTRKVANCVETSVKWIEMLMLRSPDIPQPLIFCRSNGQNSSYLLVFEVECRQAFQSFRQFHADMIDIAELFRHGK